MASVLDNDVDPDGPNAALTLQNVPATLTFPNGATGTISILGSRQLSIDPGAGRGTATFGYTVRDGDGAESAPATVTVFAPALNQAPIANDQTIDVTVGRSADLVLDVSDPDRDPLTLIDVSDPSRCRRCAGRTEPRRRDDRRRHLPGHVPGQRRGRPISGCDRHDQRDRGARPADDGTNRRRRPNRRQPATGERVVRRSDRRLRRQRTRCHRVFGAAIAASIASRQWSASCARRSGRCGAP